jgi:predicted phosphodiesterase
MKRRFPDAAVVVFGHSHFPVDEPGQDGQILFNPGSATQRRRAPTRSLGRLAIGEGKLIESEIVALVCSPER